MKDTPTGGKWISNYVFVAGHKLTNHVVEVDDDSRLVVLTALLDELANTEYVPYALCVVPRRLKRRLQSVFERSGSVEEFEKDFAQSFEGCEVNEGRVLVAAIDFEAVRLRFLNKNE